MEIAFPAPRGPPEGQWARAFAGVPRRIEVVISVVFLIMGCTSFLLSYKHSEANSGYSVSTESLFAIFFGAKKVVPLELNI